MYILANKQTNSSVLISDETKQNLNLICFSLRLELIMNLN